MTRRMNLCIALGITGIVFLLNAIFFFSSKCNSEYLESVSISGESQIISKQALNRQRMILDAVPKDKCEARKDLNQLIKRWDSLKEDPLLGEKQPDARADYAAVLTLIENSEKYDQMRHEMSETVDDLSQIDLFARDGYQEELAFTAKDFYGVSKVDIPVMHDNGINLWMNDQGTDYFYILFCILIGLFCSIVYRRQTVLHVQRKSHATFGGLLCILLGGASLYISNAVMIHRMVSPFALNSMIQSYPAFYSSPIPLTLWLFMAERILMKLFAGAGIYGVAVAICNMEGKRRWMSLFIVFVLMMGEALLAKAGATEGFIYLLQEINCITLLRFERLFLTYQNIHILGAIFHRMNVFLLCTMLLYLVGGIWVIHTLKRRKEGLLEQIQYSYYEEINQKYMETRQLWHDFHNHLMTIGELLRTDRFEEAKKYTYQLEEEIDHSHILARTGMESLDVLLYQKSELAAKYDIQLDIGIHAKISDREYHAVAVCCVVGNLLDNCIEALQKVEKDRRKAEFEILQRGDMLYISSDNPYVGELVKEGTKLQSTKENATAHGIGLQGVKRVCEKNGGSLLINTDHQHFRVQALLMADKEK